MPQATTSVNLHKTHFSPGNVILHVIGFTVTVTVEMESSLKLLLRMVLPINLHNLGMYQSKGPIR